MVVRLTELQGSCKAFPVYFLCLSYLECSPACCWQGDKSVSGVISTPALAVYCPTHRPGASGCRADGWSAFKVPFVRSAPHPLTKAACCLSPLPSFLCQPCTTPAGTWKPPPVMTKPWGSCVGRTPGPATPPTGSSTCSIRTTARRLLPSRPFSQVDSQAQEP